MKIDWLLCLHWGKKSIKLDEALNSTRWEERRKCSVRSGKVLDKEPQVLDGLVVA